QVQKLKRWKAAGAVILAFIAWTTYYHFTWAPAPPTTDAELARPAGTVTAIKPQEPGAKPAEIAKTTVENLGNVTIAARELSMVARLKTVTLAKLTYNPKMGVFATFLAALNKQNLIDARLASGNADEYVFKYKPVIVAGQIKQYWLWARPSAYSRTAIA